MQHYKASHANLFFSLFFFLFPFNIVYMFERDACPHGSLIRVGRVEIWRKVGETNVSLSLYLSFSSVSTGREEERATPFCQTTAALGDGGRMVS